jgi:uncharacterized OsmC-like protein
MESKMNDMSQTPAPTIINGLNVDDLMGLIDQVSADPASGNTGWHVATTWQDRTHSLSEVSSYMIGGMDVPRRFTIDIDEPTELGGGNAYANPQEHLIAALNACMTVGYVAQCSVRGITIDSLEITTEGEIDLRGFLGIDPDVPNGYENLRYTVHISGDGTDEQFAEVHEAVMATSPNFHNIATAVELRPTLIVG